MTKFGGHYDVVSGYGLAYRALSDQVEQFH